MPFTPPVVHFHQFEPSGVSPSGTRHLHTSPSFVKELGTGAGEYLDFGSKNIGEGKQSSKTEAVVAFITQFNDANEAVFNLRFWIANMSDWDQGTFYFNGFPSGEWIQGIALTDASGYFVPTVLPSGQNFWRDSGPAFNRNAIGFKEITASGIDGIPNNCQVSQYFYLSVTVDTDVPVKVYGGDGGGWLFKLTFDYR